MQGYKNGLFFMMRVITNTLLFLERATQIIWTHRTLNAQHYDGHFQPQWLNSEVIIGRKLISLNDIMSKFFRRGQR